MIAPITSVRTLYSKDVEELKKPKPIPVFQIKSKFINSFI